MKKFICFLTLGALCFSASAQDAGQFTLGIKGGAVFGIHISGAYTYNAYEEAYYPKINPVFGVYGAYSFFNRFSLQAEVDVMLNQGKEWGFYDGTRRTWAYSSIDIPILARYAFFYETGLLGLIVGPHLSIPVGKMKKVCSDGADDGEFDISGITWGITTGFFGGYKAGPGRFFGELRLLYDLSMVWANINYSGATEEEDILQRWAPAVTVGYEISL